MAESNQDHDTLVSLVPRVETLQQAVGRIEAKLDRCQGQRTACFEAMADLRVSAARNGGRLGALWGVVSALFVVILAALLRAYVLGGAAGGP